MYAERRRSIAIKMGLQKIKPIITCRPSDASAIKDYVEVTESASLSYVYTLLEEWGQWAAATETVQGVGSVRDKSGYVIDDETALFIDGLILTLRNKDGGSSPRMWETLNNTTEMSIRLRFIPTHVGNTFAKVEALAFLPVHPHACGKHSTSLS